MILLFLIKHKAVDEYNKNKNQKSITNFIFIFNISKIKMPLQNENQTISETNFTGVFGGFEVDQSTNTYTFPSGVELWAGVAHIETSDSIYPLIFSNEGKITFNYTNQNNQDVNIKFKIEKEPWPNTEPSFETAQFKCLKNTTNVGEISIPSQGSNTFSSLLLYIIESDISIQLTNIKVYSDIPSSQPESEVPAEPEGTNTFTISHKQILNLEDGTLVVEYGPFSISTDTVVRVTLSDDDTGATQIKAVNLPSGTEYYGEYHTTNVVSGQTIYNLNTINDSWNDGHIQILYPAGTQLNHDVTHVSVIGYNNDTSQQNSIYQSNVCLLKGTMIHTDSGFVNIEKLNGSHQIKGYNVKAVTHGFHVDNKLVKIEKDAFGRNIPNKDTFVTPNHSLYLNHTFVAARRLVNQKKGVIFVEMSEIPMVYNVLFDEWLVINANGLPVESLHPNYKTHYPNENIKV